MVLTAFKRRLVSVDSVLQPALRRGRQDQNCIGADSDVALGSTYSGAAAYNRAARRGSNSEHFYFALGRC